MKIYELESDGERKWVRFFTLDGVVLGDDLLSHPLVTSGAKIRIDRNYESTPKGSPAKLGDFSNVNYEPYPCFSGHAKSVLEPHLNGLGQWFELDCEEAPYWLFEITNIVDALDESASLIVDLGSVVDVKEFAFKPEALRDQLIFKIPQRPGSYNLVTDRFVNLVRQHRLTGFVFKLLWSQEDGPVSSKLKDYERPRITGLESPPAQVIE